MPPDGKDHQQGVLIRAENGDVITFDETGLTLKLSDTVLADLRARLAPGLPPDPVEVLGDIDAWDLRQEGAWYRFTARMDTTGPGSFQRRVEGGDIIAHAAGPLYGLFAIGGARRAAFNDIRPAHPFHVLAPGDHIGAVGLEGTEEAKPTDRLQRIRYATRETLLADALLAAREEEFRARPLYLARAETDGSATAADLSQGRAFDNLMAAADSLIGAAESLGKRAQVLSVGLDFGLEDTASDAAAHVAGLRALMARVERGFNRRGLHRPTFLVTFDSGTHEIGEHPVMQAHWELAWQHGAHDLVFAAPAYMAEMTRFGRPTEAGRTRLAEMDAHALAARMARKDWLCPLFVLAEHDGPRIRVTARALSDLVIDPADPFDAGPACGFAVTGCDGPVEVLGVEIADDDPGSLIVRCDRTPTGPAPRLSYARGGTPRTDGPANRGAIRDRWEAPSRTGGLPLHRWAYPAALPLHPGAGA